MSAPGPGRAAVAAAFGAAAATYEAHAAVQALVAERLARRIATLGLPARPRVLEIGCGTGLLSRALRARLDAAWWLFTDLSPAMVAACRQGLGTPAEAAFLAMDGERPCLATGAGFDLIAASLAFQWFADLGGALARLVRLLAPGGVLAYATLAADSFAEWRQAHADLGLAAGIPDYPGVPDLARLWPAGGRGEVSEERLVRPYADGHAFLDALRGIGAHRPRDPRRPLAPGALRRVLRRFAAPAGIAVTYHIAYGVFRREDSA